MNMKLQAQPISVAPPPPPEVETTVSSVVGPKLREWLTDLEQAIPRVMQNADDEAVHDLRVALRRIRSLLRLVGPVYGRYHSKLIRDEFKRVASATGSLRDEEVLRETLDDLRLSARTRRTLQPWRSRRKKRERALRASVVRMLRSQSLQPAMGHLGALLQLPCPPKRDRQATRFARKVVLDAQLAVDALQRDAAVTDSLAMHNLRIAYKRLRYAVEAFEPVLPPELRAWQPKAQRFQKVLGDLHDCDVALQVIRRAVSIPPDAKAAVTRALAKRRREIASDYLELARPAQPLECV